MIAVTRAPTRIPRIGFLPSTANAFAKIGASVYGATEPDMKVRPTNRRPTPIQISPARLSFFFLENIKKAAPMATTSGAKNDGCKTFIASPREFKETIHAVIVVPMFAPMMTPTAWVRFRIPAFTKPTTMTVVITNAVWIWNDYLLPFLVIGNNDKKTLTLSLYYAKSLSGQYGNPWELIFPAVLLCIIPIVIIFIILQKNIIEGISAGAVKG